MSIIQPQFRPLQQFFRSSPNPCPYLPGRVERKLFTRLAGPSALEINGTLCRAGFRRSHDIVYRPVCQGCNACVPVRIPVAEFAPGRNLRRLMKRNRDLTCLKLPALATPDQYEVFIAYQDTRHGDGDMSRMGLAEFSAMVEEGRVDSHLFELRDGADRVVGAMLADRMEDGYSAVYSFFDPAESARSLGTQLILELVQAARREGLPHVYLGYWIADSRKMAYKARFRPIEVLGRDGWVRAELPEPL